MESPSIKVAVEKGKRYYWCACGLSKTQPFCDGSHSKDEQGRKPVEYHAVSDRIISFCTCKATKSAPFCDGQHRELAKKKTE